MPKRVKFNACELYLGHPDALREVWPDDGNAYIWVSVPAVNSDLHFRAFSLAVSGLHPLDVVPRGGGLNRVSPQPVHTLLALLTPSLFGEGVCYSTR